MQLSMASDGELSKVALDGLDAFQLQQLAQATEAAASLGFELLAAALEDEV